MKRKSIVVSQLVLFIALLLNLTYVGQVRAQETIYIRPDGSIDPPTAPILRIGDDYYVFTGNILDSIVVQRNDVLVDGNGYALQGTGVGNGIELSSRQNVTIRNIHIAGWAYGIYSHDLSTEINVEASSLTGNVWRGIFFSNSTDNKIEDNIIVDNVREGIFLWRTNTTEISNNNVSNNGEDGISIGYLSFSNVIANNTVQYNQWAGISQGYQANSPTGNVISGNNITENLWTGIYFDHVNGSIVYHNNFLYNAIQVVTVGAVNFWDNGYPAGGNYWSDYTGLDSDGDGVGDTAHILESSNRDNYPFVNVWTSQAHDIAIASVTPSKRIVGQGFNATIDMTVTNQGSHSQTIKITTYANTTAIQTLTMVLAAGNSETLSIEWNTTFFSKDNWTISAYADQVPGEVDLTDNTRVDDTVRVVTPGDVNADGVVGIQDAAGVSAHWYPGPPLGPLGYDSDYDIDNDGSIGVLDAAIVSAYWTGPPKGPLAP